MNAKKLIILRLIFPLIPVMRMHSFKAALLRWAGAEVGNDVEISSYLRVLGTGNLKIGDKCYLGHYTILQIGVNSTFTMEANSKVGSRCVITTGTHRFSSDGDCIEKECIAKDIKICKGAVVSTGSVVLPGTTIHRMAHVVGQSLVLRDVPEFTRVMGVPATPIQDLNTLTGEDLDSLGLVEALCDKFKDVNF